MYRRIKVWFWPQSFLIDKKEESKGITLFKDKPGLAPEPEGLGNVFPGIPVEVHQGQIDPVAGTSSHQLGGDCGKTGDVNHQVATTRPDANVRVVVLVYATPRDNRNANTVGQKLVDRFGQGLEIQDILDLPSENKFADRKRVPAHNETDNNRFELLHITPSLAIEGETLINNKLLSNN